jgi:NAD(P)-dependent dehydrogenase (short-subunit alcohol dehydrogenase family)
VSDWNPRRLPSLDGKSIAVTGGSSGIGYFIAEQLAGAGARVSILARSRQKADLATAAIRRRHAHADLAFVPFDLESLSSVRAAAVALEGPLDGIALNAGLVWPPRTREETNDGFERMVGANFVGHFAFVAAAFAKLAPAARIVSAGSMSTRTKKAEWDDLMQERGAYDSSKSYPNSKHAVQAFGFELDRRLRESGSGIQSLVAHPGFALDVQSPKREEVNALSSRARAAQTVLRPVTQGKDRGAWPMVRALVDPSLHGGDYLGPSGGLKGRPALRTAVAGDRDQAVGAALWARAEGWIGLPFRL